MGQRHVCTFSAGAEGRISYGHLGRTNLFNYRCKILPILKKPWPTP